MTQMTEGSIDGECKAIVTARQSHGRPKDHSHEHQTGHGDDRPH